MDSSHQLSQYDIFPVYFLFDKVVWFCKENLKCQFEIFMMTAKFPSKVGWETTIMWPNKIHVVKILGLVQNIDYKNSQILQKVPSCSSCS